MGSDRYFFIIILGLQVIANSFAAKSSKVYQNDRIKETRHCDRDYCHSIVSKCRSRTLECSCNIRKDAQCAKRCLLCLEEKFGKCCACVDLCPPHKEELYASHVGDINDTTFEDLFSILTETKDIHGRWNVETSSSGKEFLHPDHGLLEITYDQTNKLVLSQNDVPELGSYIRVPDRRVKAVKAEEESDVSLGVDKRAARPRCVVAFINQQLTMNNCKRYCRSMGASSYRWFEDGCCECVGKFCIHYGIDKPKCHIEYD